MELYGFGFNGHDLFPNFSNNYEPFGPKTNRDPVLSPKRHVRGRHINILWLSWSDAVVQVFRFEEDCRPGVWADPLLVFTGEGLSTCHVSSLATLLKDSDDHDAQSTYTVFGEEFGEGPRGAIIRSSANSTSCVDTTVMVFFSESERQEAGRRGETFKIKRKVEDTSETFEYEVDSKDGYTKGEDAAYRLTKVAITSGGAVSAVAEHLNPEEQATKGRRTPAAELLSFPSLTDFRAWPLHNQYAEPHIMWHEPLWPLQNNWKQLIANSITFTALSDVGAVFTWAPDRRHRQCLGRDTELGRAEVPCQVEFLSETKVVKVASGGYMTAALSDDGELFLWGQACPGIKGELRILKSRGNGDDEVESEVENEQDESVKCVEIMVQGQPARVVHVAVGSGHVLVAAELETENGIERAVFAAGQCEYGQLGIGEKKGFVEDFVEVSALRGKKVLSLAAAGWSSWVVIEQA